MTELTPEHWQQALDAETRRLSNMLSLGELADNASQLDGSLSLDVPTPVAAPHEFHLPGSILDLTDEEANTPGADVGHGASTQYIGAVADGMQEALNRGRASGIYKKKPFWQD